MTTASILFAGRAHRCGPCRCYYCGAPCDDTHKTADCVKDTFTNRDCVKYPNSPYVCAGCALSIGDGQTDTLLMLDGTVKHCKNARSASARMYSWLLSSEAPRAFTKAHIALIRELLTDAEKLPEPPFSVILSDSGQKNLIFRAPVAYDKAAFPIMLEEVIYDVDQDILRNRAELAGKISEKIGKPILREAPCVRTYAAAKQAQILSEYEEWTALMNEPLSHLAAWLAPPKRKEE